MDTNSIEHLALLLAKDAQDIATKQLEFDQNTDISTEQDIVNFASSIEITQKKQQDLILSCLGQFDSSSDFSSNLVETNIKDQVKEEIQNADTHDHRWVTDFSKATNKMHEEPNEDDDELEVVEESKVDIKKKVICPITRCEFVNPVKNTACGHTYSRDAIYHLLNSQRTTKCPVAGCRATVLEKNLVTDEDMVWLLEQKDY